MIVFGKLSFWTFFLNLCSGFWHIGGSARLFGHGSGSGLCFCSKVATKDGKVIKRLSEKISMVADAGHFSDPAVASSYSRIFRPAAEYPVLPARPFKPVRAE
jgi:hypothetical protein